MPRQVESFDSDATGFGGNGEFRYRQLACGYQAWSGGAVDIALRHGITLKAEVINGIAGRATVRNPHLLRPRLERDVESVRQ